MPLLRTPSKLKRSCWIDLYMYMHVIIKWRITSENVVTFPNFVESLFYNFATLRPE